MQNVYFKSKKDWWLAVVVLSPVLVMAYAALTTGSTLPMLVIGLPVALLMAWFWWGTGYTFIDDNCLRITCGPVRGLVHIDKIISVAPSRSPISSAALSLDRLKVTTSERGWNRVWYISPQDKEGFLLELMKRNPRILV